MINLNKKSTVEDFPDDDRLYEIEHEGVIHRTGRIQDIAIDRRLDCSNSNTQIGLRDSSPANSQMTTEQDEDPLLKVSKPTSLHVSRYGPNSSSKPQDSDYSRGKKALFNQ